MNFKKLSLSMALAIATITISTAVFAHDTDAPSWRGETNPNAAYTYQAWEFNTDANPALPDVVNNSFGVPEAIITLGEFGSGWQSQLPGMGDQTGYWDLGGAGGGIDILIPNRPQSPPNSYKDIRVQVTCFVDITGPASVIVPGANLVNFGETLVERVDTGGAWINYWYDFHIEPNPDMELISIRSYVDDTGFSFGSVVDEVVVDTRCVVVPEPGTIFSIVAGGMGLLLIKRRRK